MSKAEDRKAALTAAAARALTGWLQTTDGIRAFGPGAQLYQSAKETNTQVIETADGEYYFVKIQKSLWEAA